MIQEELHEFAIIDGLQTRVVVIQGSPHLQFHLGRHSLRPFGTA